MPKRKESKESRIARRLYKARKANSDHKYLKNILRRVRWDEEYHEIRIRYQNRIVCAYCGMPSTGLDHFVPLSKVEDYVTSCKRNNEEPKLFKVSCCAECNRLLGPSAFSTFEIKLNHLRKRLARKYEKSNPDDKLLQGRLKRRLNFDRGLKRIMGSKLRGITHE